MKRKLSFIWDWEIPLDWRFQDQDGIWAALRILAKDWDVQVITRGAEYTCTHAGLQWHFTAMPAAAISQFDTDIVLCWGSLDRPWWQEIQRHCPRLSMALCFAGGPTQHPNTALFGHIFVESAVYERAFQVQSIPTSRAFGTNTAFFTPMNLPQRWEAIYPSAFCAHKQIELFCKSTYDRGLVVGGHNEEALVGKALSLGTHVLPRVSADTLRWLYNMSMCCVMPAGPDGGGQRICLEAMSCGLPVIIVDNNDKCQDFTSAPGCILVSPFAEDIRDAISGIAQHRLDKPAIRKWVQDNYNETQYAQQLHEPLDQLCPANSTS